jgi:maltooligosyltrehalose synthase
MYDPVATYRLQFHKGFRFADLQNILGYLQQLGVTTIYASPVFTAVPGSTHGYDGLDPHRINAEIGTPDELLDISASLAKNGMGWLQDIVPNHMAFHHGNKWLMDVLEKGEASEYYRFFDMIPGEKLMVPFLGSSVQEAIEKQEMKVERENDRWVLKYFDSDILILLIH